MFKNASIYRINPSWSMSLGALQEKLQEAAFVPCGLTQEKSVGWVPPRGEENGALAESVDGQWLLKLMLESKSVPGLVLARKVKERAMQIEATTGRKPGKKETRDLKDEARLELLPMAFAKQGAVLVWIDPVACLLVIDASSQGKADEVLTCLAKAMDGLGAMLLQTSISPAAAMSDWLLSQEPPAGFTVDRECELKANDDSKAVVRYANHALDIEEIQQHIRHGKVPARLAMTYDGRVSFVLNGGLQLTKISFVEGVFQNDSSTKASDRFDADAAIATGECRKLITQLLETLGGEVRFDSQVAEQVAEQAA